MKQTVEKLFNKIADFIFGDTSTYHLFSPYNISRFPKTEDTDTNIHSLFSYRYASAKKCIWLFKYKGDRKITRNLAQVLYDTLLEDSGDMYMFNNTRSLLVPLPATKRRIHEHGFNQCERLLHELGKIDTEHFFETAYDILIKTKETASQAHTKNKADRLKNLKGSFGVCHPEKIKGRNIILIDDVWTTGATINEARAELLKAGAHNVVSYTLAH